MYNQYIRQLLETLLFYDVNLFLAGLAVIILDDFGGNIPLEGFIEGFYVKYFEREVQEGLKLVANCFTLFADHLRAGFAPVHSLVNMPEGCVCNRAFYLIEKPVQKLL